MFTDEQETRIKEELSYLDQEDSYNNMLDECYPEVFNICPSRILSECDPIAYNCGLADYLDSLSDTYYEIDGEYYLINEVDELVEEMNDHLSEVN